MRPEEVIQKAIADNYIVGAGLIVRKNGKEVVHTLQGYADVENKIPVKDDTVFRLASMSKPVTAVAIMQLIEQGKLGLDDELARWIPEFSNMKVPTEVIGFDEAKKYVADPNNPLMAKMLQARIDDVKFVDASKKITIRDLLTHSSGMGMGLVSQAAMNKCYAMQNSLAERVTGYASAPLDFEPDTMTGYSPIAGFDTLGRVVEIVSGLSFSEYVKQNIAEPLGASDIGFEITEERRARMSHLYERRDDGTQFDISYGSPSSDPAVNGYFSGAAGMIGTLVAYDKFTQMLASGGNFNNAQLLKPETIMQIRTERAGHGRELMKGCNWGLGMAVFSGLKHSGRYLGEGTFGWSGAFGTHFYIDPQNDITMTLMVQSSNIGGAGSPLSIKLEEAIYKTFVREV